MDEIILCKQIQTILAKMATETTETCGLCENLFATRNKGFKRVSTAKFVESKDLLLNVGIALNGHGYICNDCVTPLKRLIKAEGEVKDCTTLLTSRVTKRRCSTPSTPPQRKFMKIKSPKLKVNVMEFGWEFQWR